MKWLTPTDWILRCVLQYPTLYNADSEELIEFALFDHLFNTIGNGIRDTQELEAELAYKEFDRDRARLFMLGETIWYGYYAVRDLIPGKYSIGERCPERGMVYCLESEKHLHPDIVKWSPSSKNTEMSPYPNFQEHFSLVYKTDFLKLASEEWLSAAQWYYRRAESFFKSDKVGSYYRAYPSNSERETTNRLREWTKTFARVSQTKSNEEISELYGYTYAGNVEDFLYGYWEQDRQRILLFISKTLLLIESFKKKGRYD